MNSFKDLKVSLYSSEIDAKRVKNYIIYIVLFVMETIKKGKVVKREKILGIPGYSYVSKLDDDGNVETDSLGNDIKIGRLINEGSTYHTIFYGKNTMGSYANQLNEMERWLVTHYVLKLKSELEELNKGLEKMYTISNRLKIFSITLIVLGALGWGYSYVNSHKSLEQVKEILADESSHGDSHEIIIHETESSSENHTDISHESTADKHAEHVMHQIHNRPYAALYVAAFFFMMISLGVLAFYAIQYASQAGWSPVLYRVMEAITYYLLIPLIVLAIVYECIWRSYIYVDGS